MFLKDRHLSFLKETTVRFIVLFLTFLLRYHRILLKDFPPTHAITADNKKVLSGIICKVKVAVFFSVKKKLC